MTLRSDKIDSELYVARTWESFSYRNNIIKTRFQIKTKYQTPKVITTLIDVNNEFRIVFEI